jgi:hypothetical protein
MSPARTLALLVCGVVLALFPTAASAGLGAPISAQPLVGELKGCPLEVSGLEGHLRSETALILSSEENFSEARDDGTITSWEFTGGKSGNAEISLAIFEPGFGTDAPTLASEHPSNAGFLLADLEHTISTSIPVSVGQGIGVTLESGAGEGNGAKLTCFDESAGEEEVLGIWEVPLTPSESAGPTSKGPGQLWFGAKIKYDEPVITSVSSSSGPAAGGQEITIKGQHLANVGEVTFPEPATIVSNTNESVTVRLPEAVTSGPVKATLFTAGGSKTFEYTYEGTPRSRTPALVLESMSEVTATSARVNATVDVIGLQAEVCNFEYEGPGVGEEEEEEGEESVESLCEPFPKAFEEGPQHVSTLLEGLSPGDTYHYRLFVATKFGHRSGRAELEASFTTPGGSGGGGSKGGETITTPITTPTTSIAPIITPALPGPHAPPIVGLLAHGPVTTTKSGGAAIKLSCPSGESTCIGTITLKTLTAVKAGAARDATTAVLTLGTATFRIAGGQSATVTVHLSAKARALLKRSHSLRARATIIAHDSAGATHTALATLTLRPPSSKHQR